MGKLVVVPTPLGNLGDVTLRALEALREADVVCAEDTRVTGKLLLALGIEGKRVERLDENLVGKRVDEIVQRVIDGEAIAYCTDAGMPGVSDPGLRLVRAVREAGAAVEVLPGPTAVATAYVASGCTDSAFYFGGFFPRKDAARAALLEQLKPLEAALVFYESPNRVAGALQAIASAFPHRDVAVCRELTKLHEEVFRGSALEVAAEFASRDSVKGEIVIVVDGPSDAERASDAEHAASDAAVRARELVDQGASSKDAVRALVKEFGIARNEAYRIINLLRGN